MKIELFLDGKAVEINKDIDFVLNKQYTELSDLTSIIVDYSKTIKIPMTPKNNELFNYIYKLDHQVLGDLSYVNYDPAQRIPMTMTYNGNLVMEGYAVLNSVDMKSRMYEINLYGQLGKIFSDMKEKTLEGYHSYDNGMFMPIIMNTGYIRKSFLSDRHSLDWNSPYWTDFFGFAPQLYGNSDVIDTKSFEVCKDNSVLNFVDIINERRGIDYADTYVGDGLDFNQYGEIRTYMTRPYVYVDKLIQLVKNEINVSDYDGYKLELDPDWFNSNNPYFNEYCYFPGRESIVDKGKSVSGFVTWDTSQRTLTFPMTYLPSANTSGLEDYRYTTSGTLAKIQTLDGSDDLDCQISLNCDNIIIRDRVNGTEKYDVDDFKSKGAWAFYNLPSSGSLPIRYIGIYDDMDNLLYKLYLCADTIYSVSHSTSFLSVNHTVWTHSGMWGKLKSRDSRNIVPNATTWVNSGVSREYCEVVQAYSFGNIILPTNKFRFKMGCDLISANTGNVIKANVTMSDYQTLCPFKNNKFTQAGALWANSGSTFNQWFRPIGQVDVTSLTYRSGSKWTIKDVLGGDFNPFTWLIDYVKKFRLFFDIDYHTKTITLKADYFKDVEYKKVIVDYDKEVVIEPLIDTYNKVTYGYADNDSKKGNQYKKRYNVVYGDMNISTGINIGTETQKLIPNDEESVFVPTLLNALNWPNLSCYYPQTPITVPQIKYGNILITNRIINTLNKDGEIEYYPFYCFRLGNYHNQIQPNVPFYRISDDSPEQKRTGKYAYLDKRIQSEAGTSNIWYNKAEGIYDGYTFNYLEQLSEIPQFENYIVKEVDSKSVITPRTSSRARAQIAELTRPIEIVDDRYKEVAFDENNLGVFEGMIVEDEPVKEEILIEDPITNDPIIITRPERPITSPNPGDGEVGSNVVSYNYLYWSTFGVPQEVYNGNVPSSLVSYSVFNRWKNYLNEIFNINNKKVTCYIRMSYPEFINFKFNQLFVIDNNVFLVNKIMDFNPNSTEPTKVELLQISDVKNLR